MGVGGGCKVFLGFVGGFGNKIKSEIVIKDSTDNKNSISTIKLNNLLTTNPNQLENHLFCIPNQKTLSKIKYKAAVSLQRLPQFTSQVIGLYRFASWL